MKLELYIGRGKWVKNISWSTANDGEFSWPIPADLQPLATYRVHIKSLPDGQYYDVSDANYTVQ